MKTIPIGSEVVVRDPVAQIIDEGKIIGYDEQGYPIIQLKPKARLWSDVLSYIDKDGKSLKVNYETLPSRQVYKQNKP